MNSRLLCSSKKTNGGFYIGTRGAKFEAFDADTRGITFSGTMDEVPTYTRGVTFPGTGFAADTTGIKTGTDFSADTRGVKTGTDFSADITDVKTNTDFAADITDVKTNTDFTADITDVKTNTDFAADITDVKTGLQCFPLPPLLSCRSWQGSFFPISHLTIAGKTL